MHERRATWTVADDLKDDFLVLRSIVVSRFGRMFGVASWLQWNRLVGVEGFPFPHVPSPLEHDGVPVLRMKVRPCHPARGELDPDDVDAGLGRVASNLGELHPLESGPLG